MTGRDDQPLADAAMYRTKEQGKTGLCRQQAEAAWIPASPGTTSNGTTSERQ
jgi:hypothetical protein